jgi:hypothetical protein
MALKFEMKAIKRIEGNFGVSISNGSITQQVMFAPLA